MIPTSHFEEHVMCPIMHFKLFACHLNVRNSARGLSLKTKDVCRLLCGGAGGAGGEISCSAASSWLESPSTLNTWCRFGL